MAILINLNDARKKLNELEGSAEYNKGVTDAFNALFDLPIVEAEPRWIPCSERLPEKPDNYPKCEIRRTYCLVSLESGCVKSLGYDFDRDEWMITGSPVVAWMPLPEPYREVKE